MRQPILRPVPSEDKYELMEDYGIAVKDIEIVVPKFFQYDGASIPAAAWQITYTPFHPDVMLPSLIHDWLYGNHQVTQEVADDIFYELLIANRVNFVKAKAMRAAVQIGGEAYWENTGDQIISLVALCKKVKNSPNFERYRFPDKVKMMCG